MSQVHCFPSGPFETNAYLLSCSQKRKGVFIDPAPGSFDELTKAACGIQIEAILLTHSHWDHIGDLKKIQESFKVPVYVHPNDKANVCLPGSDGLPLMVKIEGVIPDFDLHDEQLMTVGEIEIKVIETPGHSPGGVVFYLPKEKILFSGDTLFKGSIGNLSLPTANRSLMWNSLKKLEQLPSDTTVYPGHGPSTTIGDEAWLPKAREIFN